MQWHPKDASSQRERSPSILISVFCLWVRWQVPGFFAEFGPPGYQEKQLFLIDATLQILCFSNGPSAFHLKICLRQIHLCCLWHLDCLSAAPAMSAT